LASIIKSCPKCGGDEINGKCLPCIEVELRAELAELIAAVLRLKEPLLVGRKIVPDAIAVSDAIAVAERIDQGRAKP
jgi:hypothetical protein